MINKLQRTGKVPIPEEVEQFPIQVSTTSVRTAPMKAQFKTIRRKPTESEKSAEEIARIVLEEAANKSTGTASGIGNRDLFLQNEYPELMLMPAAAEIKAARNIGTGLLRTAAGTIVGDEMARSAANLGQKVDNVLSTRMFSPTFGFIGGLGGYVLGSNMIGGIASSLRLPRKTTVNQANYQGYMTDNQTPMQNLIQQADSPKLLTQGQSYPLVLKQTPKFYEYASPRERELQTTSEGFNEVVPRLNSLSIKTARGRILDMIASRKQRGLPAMSMKTKDMFGREVELPEEGVAAMQTPEFKAAYPNGVDYYGRGTDQPVTNADIKTQYPALFGGDHKMALGYNRGSFSGGSTPVYSMENVERPNMLLLAVPKGTITDYGDFGEAHGSSLHDQSTEAITNSKKLQELYKHLSKLAGYDPKYNDVYKQIDELITKQRDNHVFRIDGEELRSTDDVARGLNDNNKAGGALLRNINDGPVANEIIYNHHLIAPKIVTPYSTFEYNLGNESFLKQGGIIKFQKAGSLPKGMQKLNSGSIPNSDESAGERIFNSTIKEANNASTQEERDKIYKDSAKNNLAVTGQSLMMLPMLGEFTTYGLLGGGLRLGTGLAGSKAGEYVLGTVGNGADKKLNTKFLGTTGRIIGGLGGGGGGSSATTSLFRNLAGKGITLHIPQETFMNLRGQYFDRVAKNIKLDASTLPKLQYHDRLIKDYLEFGPDPNVYGYNVSKLVHGDPMTTGTRSALPINGGFNRDPIYFPHFENGKLVPAIGEIQSKIGNGQMYKHPYHPIFFGGNKPGGETPGGNLSDQYLKEITFDKSKFTGPKQYYDHGAKRQKQNLRNLRNGYTKYGPQNKSARYLITDPENLSNYEFSYKLGIMGSDVSMSKLEGFEYDPLLGTFKRAKYIDPSISTISPQEAVTTYHFDGRMPLSKPISEAELKGWTKQFRNQKRGQISASEYSGLPKGERNNGRYGDIRFIRHMDAVPEITKDGFVQVAPEENGLANFTTDQLMVPHKSYPVEGIGKNVLVISPEAFRGTTPFSLDPGDSFFINRELKIKPKHVTFISGDPQSIQLAKERGFNVETSPKLKILSELSKQATWEELQTMRPALEKRGYWLHGREYPKVKSDYVDELNRILHSRFNRPSLKDYSNIESVTGVPTHTYSRSTAPGQSFFGPKTGYQQAIYDTTPQIEHDLMKQIGSYAHPMAESMEGYSPLFFRLLKGGTPIKKQGGIIKGQNGFLNTGQKAYNSKFGKGLRDFMFGNDRDLSDEEYLEKYGYNKPVGSIGILGALVAPEGEGLEIPEITAQHIGNQGKVLRGFENGNSKMLKVPIKETSKKVSNGQKFLKLSQQEQDDFVKRGNGESFKGYATLKGDKQALSRFRSGINSRK